MNKIKENQLFIGNTDTLTLHIRVTKKCNADCVYCSSYETKLGVLMGLDELEKSLLFIKEKIMGLGLGGSRKSLTVQYIGGELLVLNKEYLTEYVGLVKKHLSPLFENFRHGAQSNLIGSKDKVLWLNELFDKNIGTSIDSFTEQRTVKGDANKYKTIFLKNVSALKRENAKSVDGIIVLDKQMVPFVHEEIMLANKNRRNIIVRPVFEGGIPDVQKLTIEKIDEIFLEIFNNWFLKQNIIVDPFFTYLKKRVLNKMGNQDGLIAVSGCPSQHNCGMVSLNLEPNGDLYTCLDLADSKQLKLGNSIESAWDSELFDKIVDRSNRLQDGCYSCDYFKECQGGCMKEAIEHGHGYYGKTDYCVVWKTLFKAIDEKIEKVGLFKINNWINKLEYMV